MLKCDLANAFKIARHAIDTMEADGSLTVPELAGLSFVVQTCHNSVELIAGQCMLPFFGGTRPLITMADRRLRAIASLRFALERLDQAKPLTLDAGRAMHGIRFAVQAVLFALEAAAPESDASEVRFTLAAA